MQKSDENKEKYQLGVFVDPIPNSPSKHHKNYIADIKENYLCDLKVEGLRERESWE